MKSLLILFAAVFLSTTALAATIVVKNIEELKAANKSARPGDEIILENGEWNNAIITLDCNGSKEMPITFRARNAGKVQLTGLSQLKLGGSYIVVDGLFFTKGYAGEDAVIDFRINKDKLANNCRVTNTVINDFNNPKRMDENIWVSFSGKNNRLDHCSFLNKKNMGVVLAVILDNDRSRENFHSIDHNYFGLRQPLASNGGEIIRVGVSQHCQFNSNTSIADNFFEDCDGETEIISIKSGSNIIRNNLFYRCQGGVVLRHGDNNTVENNLFIGNDKEGTGGVRIINKGQWVVNNFFYKCRGVDFRSPLSIMNGVPNSPAHRYVQVTEAVIANNSFFDCTPASFCEGSDKERSLPPDHVFFANNLFHNSKDTAIYKAYDNISGFRFSGNMVSRELRQQVPSGFERTSLTAQKMDNIPFPVTEIKTSRPLPDSLQQAARLRLKHELSASPGFSNLNLARTIRGNSSTTGAPWFERRGWNRYPSQLIVDCPYPADIYKALSYDGPVVINLTGNNYAFDKPVVISGEVAIYGPADKSPVTIGSGKMLAVFVLAGKGKLTLQDINIDGSGVRASHFISSDTSGSSEHYNLLMKRCSVSKLDRKNGCTDLFFAYKSMVADSIVLRNNNFSGNQVDYVVMNQEKADKGYYNAERIVLENNTIRDSRGIVLDIYRGGNDESTMGPRLYATNNNFTAINPADSRPMVQLMGVQRTWFAGNTFQDCYQGKKLFIYKDIVRAEHVLEANTMTGSGSIDGNDFLKRKQGITQ